MSTHNYKFTTNLSKALLVAACSLGFAVSANAAPATNSASMTKSSPVFLGDGGNYPFSEAVRVGDTLYMSGQIGFKDGKLVKGGIKAEAKQALDNIHATLLKYGYQKSDIVKCMVMLTDMDDFDDFNKVYKAELTKPYPVRSAFGVAELAAGASVEVECTAAK
ncbi:RidA family protein [Psychrobacter sp. K31L]|uniref:RidA family protein n=1 Tax=Psychrobacter sp. K31L TaxID=2820758 RepID=UPI001B318DDE|nr:RidA family protein [Psychrobacter sp. K31L]MBP3946418.1 RidA family protein [Psychrobacter sp. K31L]